MHNHHKIIAYNIRSIMKKNILPILFLLVGLSIIGRGQELAPEIISSSGESHKTSELMLSWTIGEPVTSTLEREDLMLTQGFHQGRLTVSSIDNSSLEKLSLEVFPNPAKQLIQVRFSKKLEQQVLVEVYNLQGKKIITTEIASGEEQQILQLESLPSGTYILRITHNRQFNSYKIIKQ